MAELEGVIGTHDTNLSNQKVELEWLDYDFIKNCNDKKQLTLILNTLKSGKEGLYPQVGDR